MMPDSWAAARKFRASLFVARPRGAKKEKRKKKQKVKKKTTNVLNFIEERIRSMRLRSR